MVKKEHGKLSFESDGKMGKQKKAKNQEREINEKDMFFNTTQNSE